MPKINKEEYELLISIVFYWKWIARDRDGRLYKFHGKPEKVDSFRWNDKKQTWLGMSSDRFQFIQWEDEEPYNVTELIEEYGEAQHNYSKNEPYEQFYKESEETKMKKNLDWLVQGIHDEREQLAQSCVSGKETDEVRAFNNGKDEALSNVLDSIDQLDDPKTVEQTALLLENALKENKRLGKLLEEKHEEWLELMDEINNQEVLSQEWIEQKSIDTHVDTLSGEVQMTFRLDDLENLLVPKQKEVKRAQIPKWIIEWYQGANNEFSTLEDVFDNLSHDTGYSTTGSDKLRSHIMKYGGYSKMYEALSHIYFGAYEIEEEQKYIVVLGKSIYNTTTYGQIGEVNSKKIMQSVYANEEGIIAPNQYTKSEILEVKDGEGIFKRFAVKVEEVEE